MTQNQIFSTSWPRKISYSIATFGSAAVGGTLTTFAFFFYKEVVYKDLIGVSAENQFWILTLLGTALAIGWWIQALMNPVAGWLSDKLVSTRFGRRKPWLLLGSPVIAISFIAIFMIPAPATDIFFPIVWLAVFNGIYNAAYAATFVVYLAVIPEICQTPEERTSISTYRQGFSLVGFVLGVIIGAFVEFNVFIVVILAGFMFICLYITVFGIKEPEGVPETPTFGIVEALKVTFRNKPFLPYLGYTIFATAFQEMMIRVLPIFGREIIYKGKEVEISSYIPGAFVVTAFLSLIPAMFWINRVGKKKAVIYSLVVAAVLASLLFTVGMIPFDPLIHTLIIVLLIGFPAAPLLVLPDSIISDITDYDEIVTGTRREAMHFASQGLLTRFSGGVSVQLLGLILGIFGSSYGEPSLISTIIPGLPTTLGVSLIGPVAAIILFIGLLIFWKYPEDEVLGASGKKLQT
ncbi:MAG: MFS transporter [Candidatus Heimdallarchaeota archaeon]|nr:MAG: MFS transporter [Candidatus Heimdallarchaeota archaeon]